MTEDEGHQQHNGVRDIPSPANGYVPVPTAAENGGDPPPPLTGVDTPREAVEDGTSGQDESVQNGEKEVSNPHTRKGVTRRKDAYDVDFSDTRAFAAYRWTDIMRATAEKLAQLDCETAPEYCDWESLADEIQKKLTNQGSTIAMKRQLRRIQPFPRVLSALVQQFEGLVAPHQLKFDLLWGLIYLNLRLSYDSPERFKRTTEWLGRIRQITELFSQCIGSCEAENEVRLALVDFFDPIVVICMDSVEYLRECWSDSAAIEAWPGLNDSLNEQISIMNATVKHVGDITSFSKANMVAKVKNMALRHALTPESEEPGTFPNMILPFRQNPRFFGRVEELKKINDYLSPKGDQSLRTYTIYGRRGVGKTEIALHFAHTNQAGFDAIFWVRCESLVSIRQSFTDIAVSLDLPGADKDGHHEENLLAVHGWLKKTRKRWLLIFDNAGQDYILQGYWPVGASGAILITSRKYYNFCKDTLRQGTTIKPFDPKPSWDLLLQLLGDDWKKLDREGRIPQSEITAAKQMLGKLGGLALAIQQAAILIKNDEIGGPTIVKTYEMFEKTFQTLPGRLLGERGSTDRALDTLWDMTFNSLTKNARILLSVLAWLSPDVIQVQLFLPQNQRALDGRLQFCKQASKDIGDDHKATNYSLATTSPEFDKAVDDLLQKELIKQDGRNLSIHRVVQEATNYHNKEDLQDSFDSASQLVYEAFPRQILNQSLYKKWDTCQDYIPHGVHLRKSYLFEISDLDTCDRVNRTALKACEDKKSSLYAELLNIAGRRDHELNRLLDCRMNWEETLRIRELHLPGDHILIGTIYHNLGNLETATGHMEEAMEYYNKATSIYLKGDDKTAFQLALTDLCIGRVYMLQYKFAEARKAIARSEALFVRVLGTDKGFTVHVHYAYGNLEFMQENWEGAAREYEICLKIALSEMPIHPITAAAYYSLGCVELEMGHPDNANFTPNAYFKNLNPRGNLDKAKAIAELRSPTRDDGTIARILWKTAVVMESDTFGEHVTPAALRTYAAEAADLRRRAELARQQLLADGEGGIIPYIDETIAERNEEEDSYDVLLPLYFR
ncbi:hypothetical protein GP486_001804 [Trichoglossum hirsutum]|uniref:NB-ARC domain-containing protein n=1 Tax=Trichoglossum hirsutum TaxID=265104 RepID=A0A9P8LG82_9PEZI|nr:hypothetical protein GP486_001804 [Trichoglossum hirsutum]